MCKNFVDLFSLILSLNPTTKYLYLTGILLVLLAMLQNGRHTKGLIFISSCWVSREVPAIQLFIQKNMDSSHRKGKFDY